MVPTMRSSATIMDTDAAAIVVVVDTAAEKNNNGGFNREYHA